MAAAAAARTTLPERLFPLTGPADVDRLLDGVEWCAIFKAGTSEKTFDAWRLVQRALEPRVDVAVGLVQLPSGRAASDHVSARSAIVHKSPQVILFRQGAAVASLDEGGISGEALGALVGDHLPSTIGRRVVNEAVASLAVYRSLVTDFVEGRLPEERFQWAYLERLAREAAWRDDETFAVVNGLFENPWDRDVQAARLVAHEFQGQLAGRLEPLKVRAARLVDVMARTSTSGRIDA